MVVAVVLAGAAGFVAGRSPRVPWASPAPSPSASPSPAELPSSSRSSPASASPSLAPSPTPSPTPSLSPNPSPNPSLPPAAPAACAAELARTQARLGDLERQRLAVDGPPIAPRSDAPSRFQERLLTDTVQIAFRATKIDGRVDTVDCSEYPCILYGRVNGDEELVAKLEDSKPFAAYDNDIGVMLTWASGDRERGKQPKVTSERSKPSEVCLFAFAFYTSADKAKHGDDLDRRIRSRTADLWNTLHPDDP